MSEDPSRFTQQNRRAWNEIASVRSKTFPSAGFFAQGGSTLDERVLQAAGDFRGRSLLHLQCATGEDTISWAVLGVRAAGVDISEDQIALARQKAQEAGLDVYFEAADVYGLPDELRSAKFDFVFTGGGALVWLPDIDGWAEVVRDCLKPGGRLLLHDLHPLTGCLWQEDGRLVVSDDYFGRHNPIEVSGWAHFSGGEDAIENKYEFNWPLGDIVTAVARAGLVIERLVEYPGGPQWSYGNLPEAVQLPGEFLLTALKPD